MRVVVTRPAHEAALWVDDLRARGVDALSLPLIRIAAAPPASGIAAAWSGLPGMRAAMFVSSNAVRHFFDAAAGARWPGGVRAWATGPGTARALAEAGVSSSLIDSPMQDSAQFDSEALWLRVAAQVSAGDRVLVVRGADAANPGSTGRDWLELQLGAAGAQVSTVVAYLRAMPAWSDAEREQAASAAAGAAWLFSSSQAIANLKSLLPRQDWAGARAIATHPRIAQAAREAGFGVVCVSRPAVDAVVAALESFG